MSEPKTALDYAYMNLSQFIDRLPEVMRQRAKSALEGYKQAQEAERQRAVSEAIEWTHNYHRCLVEPTGT